MSAEAIHLAAFAALSVAALAAAAIAVCSASTARQAAALAGLAAVVAAVLAGFLGCGFAAAAILMAQVAIAGLVLVTAARWGWGDRTEPPVGRLSLGVSALAVGVGTVALLAAFASLEVLVDGPAEVAPTAGAVGRHLSGARLLLFLLVSFLLLTGVGGLVAARRRENSSPVGGGDPGEGGES